MAAIHTESAAIFGAKNVNVSEESVHFVDYKPVNPITPNTVIEFNIPGTGDKYISLKDSQFDLKFDISLVESSISRMDRRNMLPRKPRVPVGYGGQHNNIMSLTPQPNKARGPAGRTAREAGGTPGPQPPREGEEQQQQQPDPENNKNKKRKRRRVRRAAAAQDMIPKPEDFIFEERINLNDIRDPVERRQAVEQYEQRVEEWNDYVSTFRDDDDEYPYLDHAFPIDAIFHTMWNGVDVFMNQQLVSTTNTMYAYKAYIEALLNNTYSTKKFHLRNVGYTGPENTLEPTILFGNSDANPFAQSDAIALRKERFQVGKTYQLRGYLSSDMWNINAAIVNGVEINIKLYPNKDAFRLMSFPPGIEAVLNLREITMKVCHKKMAPKIIVAHNAVMESKKDSTYPFTRTEVRSFNVAKGNRAVTIENPYQSNIPARLIIGMVRADAKAGQFSRNPLAFQHFDISEAGFFINNEPVPRRPYQLDPQGGIYSEPLCELYQTLGNMGNGEDLGISHEEYLNGCFLIPFDVQPTAAGDLHYLAKRAGGHCRIELLFKEPLPQNICVITYAIFPSMLEIDYPRNVRVVDLEKPFRVAAAKGSVNTNQAAIAANPTV